MAPHSSTLARKIPWTEEPGRLQSMGSLRVEHDLATSLSLFTFMHWSRTWQPTPVFLPGESQGRRSLVGCRLWGHTQLDTTEATQHSIAQQSVNRVLPSENSGLIKETELSIMGYNRGYHQCKWLDPGEQGFFSCMTTCASTILQQILFTTYAFIVSAFYINE